MKIRQILPLILLTFAVSSLLSSVSAQEFSVNAGGDLVTRYVWRGADINSQPNIQPYLTFGYSGLQVGFWGSYGLDHLNSTDENYAVSSEIDTWMGYSVNLGESMSVTAQLTDYYYPNAGIGIGNFNNYDNASGPGAHTVEAGLIIAGTGNIPLSFGGFVNVYNDKGHNAYFQLDYSASVKDIDLGFFVGAAAGSKDNPGYYGTDKFNFINVGLKASKSIKITDNFSLPVYCSYILNPKSELAFFVLGISI